MGQIRATDSAPRTSVDKELQLKHSTLVECTEAKGHLHLIGVLKYDSNNTHAHSLTYVEFVF